MAGLVVIDFIDMEQSSHNRKVEKAMKEALKHDRARIQVGRISSFGLMEMSRQRLRTGVLEASTKPCPHCDGTGLMRTAASAGLSALRIIEDEAARGRGDRVLLRAGTEAAVYVLNKKRTELAEIEHRYGVSIEIVIDEGFEGARMTVESSGARPIAAPRVETPPIEEEEDEEETVEISLEGEEDEEEAEERDEEREAAGEGERHGRRRRRRRRGGRGRGRREEGEAEHAPPSEEQAEAAGEPQQEEIEASPEEEPAGKRRRRRRGGKSDQTAAEQPEGAIEPDSSPMVERPIDEEPPIAETESAEEPQPKPKRRRSKKAAEAEAEVAEPAPAEAPPAETADQAAPPEKPARKRRTKAKAEPEQAEPAAEEAVSVPAANNDTAADASGEPRRGWWQRTFG
jgi:ribonuclease E